MTPTTYISDRRRIAEIVMVIITGTGRLVFTNLLEMRYVFLFATLIFWIGYIVYSVSQNRHLLKYWGLTFTNSKTTLKVLGAVGTVAFLLIIYYGLYNHTISFNQNIILILFLYPFWTLIQQFLIMSLFAGNLKDLTSVKLNDFTIIIITSVLFGVVHFPSVTLIVVTFFMALLYTYLFLKERNIIPLGLFHGVLGSMFFYAVLKKDLWFELVEGVRNWF